MTRTKRDSVDPDDPTRFQRWCISIPHCGTFTFKTRNFDGDTWRTSGGSKIQVPRCFLSIVARNWWCNRTIHPVMSHLSKTYYTTSRTNATHSITNLGESGCRSFWIEESYLFVSCRLLFQICWSAEANTSSSVIAHLKAMFARFGILATLISDNGPQFSSPEMKQFAQLYEFQHTKTSP